MHVHLYDTKSKAPLQAAEEDRDEICRILLQSGAQKETEINKGRYSAGGFSILHWLCA